MPSPVNMFTQTQCPSPQTGLTTSAELSREAGSQRQAFKLEKNQEILPKGKKYQN